MYFPISGVEVFPAIPFVFAFVVSFLGSMSGITGAFLLLPFQVSVLGFTGPAVSATNHLYNVIAGPGGVYRYWKERRFLKPLAGLMIAGTVPGAIGGIFIRIHFLPDPRVFKLFVGMVLLILSAILLWRMYRENRIGKQGKQSSDFSWELTAFNAKRLEFKFDQTIYSVSTPVIVLMTVVLGLIGGAYGIGGGVMTSPILIGVFNLPVYLTAGATILSTFIASLVSVIGFTILAPHYKLQGIATEPDWLLGLILGLGGLCGMYLGARLQRKVQSNVIKWILTLMVFGVAVKYLVETL